MRKLVFLGLCTLATGCTTVQLPLCPAVAEKSYVVGKPASHVNRYAREAAEAREISIAPLSPYVAEYSGYVSNVRWLERNYAHMLCAFEPGQSKRPESQYLSCMSHAPEWIQTVQSKTAAHLLQAEDYNTNCLIP